MNTTTKKPLWHLAIWLLGLLAIGLWLRPSEPAVANDGPLPLASIQWTAPELLSTASPNGAFSPVIRTADNGNLMVMFNHSTATGVENPHFRKSTDGGRTWTSPSPVYTTAEKATEVDFVYDHNNVAHAVFRIDDIANDRILYARENQWPGSATTLANPGEGAFSPAIAVGPNNSLYVVWSQQSNEIYYTFSQDGGNSWSSPAAISSGGNKSDVANVAVDGSNNVHVVWEERIFVPGPPPEWHYEIRYKKGTVSGSAVSWQANPTTLSGASYDAHRPAIIAESNQLHVGYARHEPNDDQYPFYTTRIGNGNWSVPVDTSNGQEITVNTNSPFYLLATLAVCDQNVYLYYHGAVTTNAKEQILGGSDDDDWESRDEVTDATDRDINPAITCVGGNLHLVYSRVLVAGQNHQVYYTAGQPSGLYMPVLLSLN